MDDGKIQDWICSHNKCRLWGGIPQNSNMHPNQHDNHRYFQQSPNYSYSFYFCTFPQSVILGKPGWLFYKHTLDHVVSLLKLFQWLSNVFNIKSTFLTMTHKTLHDTTYLSSFDQPRHPNCMWTTPALSVVPACQICPLFALVISSASCALLAHFSSSLKPQFKCLILRNLSWPSYFKVSLPKSVSITHHLDSSYQLLHTPYVYVRSTAHHYTISFMKTETLFCSFSILSS